MGSVKFLYSCNSQEDSRLNSMILLQLESIGYNLMDAGTIQIIMFSKTKENVKRHLGLNNLRSIHYHKMTKKQAGMVFRILFGVPQPTVLFPDI